MRASLIDETGPGLPADRAGQGPADDAGAPPARGAQRPAADDHAGLPQPRLRRLAGRSRSRRSSPGRASARCPTRRSADRTCRCCRRIFLFFSAAVDPREPRRRPPLRRRRPAGAHMTTATTARCRTPAVRPAARRRGARCGALLAGGSRAAARPGMFGLAVLVLLRRCSRCSRRCCSRLRRARRHQGDRRACCSRPSPGYPLGTDDVGPHRSSRWWSGAPGSRCSSASCATVLSMVIGTARRHRRPGTTAAGRRRSLERLTDWFLVIPFLPLAIVLATRPRPVAAQHHHRHRRDLVARHRPAGPRPDARPSRRRPYLERARALGGGHWHQMTPARAAQRDAAGAGEHHAHRRDLDPVRDDAVLPRPGRPDRGVLGHDARRRLRRRGDLGGRLVVSAAAGHLRRRWSCSRFTLVGRAIEDVLDPRGR